MRSPLAWRAIRFHGPVAPGAARALLTNLAVIPGQPRLVLEAVANDHAVDWRVGTGEAAMPKVRAAFRAHLPGVRLEPARSTFDDSHIDRAASVAVPCSRNLPLRHDGEAIEQVTRQLFDVFASAAPSDLIRLQLVLGPRTTPRRAPVIDGFSKTAIEAKFGQYGFGCALRIAARSGDPARTRQLISVTAAAFRVLQLPGVRIELRGQGMSAVEHVRSPFFWPLWLTVEDLVALTGWPVTQDPETDLPALPPRHPKLLPVGIMHPRKGRPVGDAADAARRGGERLVAQSQADALMHTHLLGLNGTGKSTLLAHLVLHDLEEGRGGAVIDPKGDLIDDILARVPKHRLDDIVVLDPRHPLPVGINPLASGDPDLAADSLLSVFHTIFADSWGPRTSDILHAALLTLARRGDASLLMIPLLLTNPGFRRSVASRVAREDPLGLGTFWATFESWSEAERAKAIQPLMNKLRTVLMRPSLRAVFGQTSPKFDLSDVFNGNKMLLVSLGKGAIGYEGARLLGSLVTTQLWHAVLNRTVLAAQDCTPVNIYIDEVQDYISGLGDLGDALATARGYGVGFTIAHQELGQLGAHKGAVLANARSRVVFQTSPSDARELAANLAPNVLAKEDFRALGQFQAYAALLDERALTPWVPIVTRSLGKRRQSPEHARRTSSARYGASLVDTEAAILDLLNQSHGQRATTSDIAMKAPGPDAPTTASAEVDDAALGTALTPPTTETFGRRRRAHHNLNNNDNSTEGGTS